MNGKAMLIPFLLLSLSACAEPEKAPSVAASSSDPALRGHQEQEEAEAEDLPLRALSLRALQQMLAACAPAGGSCPEEALSFGRITRVLGYSLDRNNHDVLVYGLAAPELPRIRTDDFLVALRSSWFRYTEGNVYQYPGCDIRPNPDLVRRLQEVGGRLFGSEGSQETEAVLRSWEETCELPQDVSVLGIPFDTHFGHVMVAADYDMKRLADGSDALGLPGLESVMGLEMRSAESAIRGRRPVAMKASMNRFWLTPGDQVYEEADGITWIRSCPVRIRTHPIGVAAGGELSDVEGSDVAAEEFARRFSALYAKVAEQRPIYRELWSLFQVFALTQTLRFRQAPEQVGLDLGSLLDAPIEPVSLQRQVPGRHAVQRFHHERKIPNGTEVIQFWMPSCGGVEMRIEPQNGHFRQSGSEALDRLGGRLAEARPASSPVAWNVWPGDQASIEELKHALRLQDINQPGSALVVTVEDQGSEYRLYTDRFGLLYKGLDVEAMMRQVNERRGSEPHVYIQLERFSNARAELFTAESRRRLKELSPEVDVRALRDVAGTLMEKVLFTSGIRLDKTEPATLVNEGPFQGLYRALVTFSVWVQGKLYLVKMSILFTSVTVVDAFLEIMQARFSLSNSLDLSPIDLVDQTRRELVRRFGNPAGEIRIEIEIDGEVERSQTVELVRTRDEEPV